MKKKTEMICDSPYPMVGHEDLPYIFEKSGEHQHATMLLGRTGCGKSDGVKDYGKGRAKKSGKTFRLWNQLSEEEKESLAEGRDESISLYTDIRMTDTNPDDWKGIPNLTASKLFVKWLGPCWVQAMKHNHGIILLDEFNHAEPYIQKICYKLLLDRDIGDVHLNDDVQIIALGNLTEDNGDTYDLLGPTQTRMAIYQLKVPTAESSCEWDYNNGVDDRVIMYKQRNPDHVFIKDAETNFTVSPRQWTMFSEAIKGENNLENIKKMTGWIGNAVGTQFYHFMANVDQIPSARDVIEGKAKIPNNLDHIYLLVTQIIGELRQSKKQVEDMKKVIALNKKYESIEQNGKECYIWTLRLTKRVDIANFKKAIGQKEIKILNDYAKFLID
jgi:hypothetical protein